MPKDNSKDLRQPAEIFYAEELDALIKAEKHPVPAGWRMSPRSVLTYICGGKCGKLDITPKYIGHQRLVEIAISTLATDRALLLIGEPGTAKSCSIFASLPALNTRVVAFDTEVVDLTEQCGHDPVDMIFGVQLGGGTDINKSVAYCEKFITDPAQTIFFLITDLFEGGNQAQLVRRLKDMVESGVRVICLLALSDSGIPTYDEQLARKISEFGVPCFGCTPNTLPELIEGVLKKHDLKALAARIAAKKDKPGAG